ncbi:MAG: hypothetical protein JO061_22285, partial [Acidobacteriaceae bacterium]|nr:hypothetical protein [Acidobacteriaceae bacterium]
MRHKHGTRHGTRRVGRLCATAIILLGSSAGSFSAIVKSEKGSAAALTTVSQISHVSNAHEIQKVPVAVRAVVTYSDPGWGILFIQDKTGGTFVDSHALHQAIPDGRLIELDGHTGPGDAGALINRLHVSVVGAGVLPEPKIASIEVLNSKRDDFESQLVETQGVVHTVEDVDHRLRLRVYEGNQSLTVIIREAPAGTALSLTDARIHLRGVCGSQLDSNNKPIGTQIFVSSLQSIHFDEPTPADPFATPAVPVKKLSSSAFATAHRIHIRTAVSYLSTEKFFFAQDDSGPIRVETATPQELQIGEAVDVVGFVARTPGRIVLSDAVVRRTGKLQPVRPLDLDIRELMKSSYQGTLVRANGTLLNVSQAGEALIALVQDGNRTFTALL